MTIHYRTSDDRKQVHFDLFRYFKFSSTFALTIKRQNAHTT